MADRSADHNMEDVEQPTSTVDKGKGKAPDVVEESAEDDSSDESGMEDQVCIPSYPIHAVAND